MHKYEVDEQASDSDAKVIPAAIKTIATIIPPTFETFDASIPGTNKEPTELWQQQDEELRLAQFLKGSNGERMVPIIALEADVNRVPKQRFACVSVIKPDQYAALHHGERKYKGLLMKIRGVFETREQADSWIRERILPLDPHFDVHLIECHKWSGVEDDDINDREYADENIRSIMTSYFKDEHDKQLGLQTRIEIAKNLTERSKESGDFFREANETAVAVQGSDGPECPSQRATMPHESLPPIPVGARPVTLDSLRSRVMPGYRSQNSSQNNSQATSHTSTTVHNSQADDDDMDELSRPTSNATTTILSTSREG